MPSLHECVWQIKWTQAHICVSSLDSSQSVQSLNLPRGTLECRFFVIGASSALDTLASQAFGAGDRSGVISWAVSSFVILSLMAIPMAIALYFGDFVARHFFQQPEEICKVPFSTLSPSNDTISLGYLT